METPRQSNERASDLGPFALYLLALVAWAGALLPGGFSFDDRQAILENPYVRGEQPVAAAFAQDYWHHIGDAGHFRPAASLSLRLDYALFGEWARGYHITSVLLHALVVLLAGLLVVRIARPGAEAKACLLGIALFAVHPALADSVAWISARSSTLAVLPGLIAALALHRVLEGELGKRSPARLRLGTACLFLLAILFGLFGKEDGFGSALFPALVLGKHLAGQAVPGRRALLLATAIGLALGLFLYGYLRWVALGSPWPSAPHAPLAGAPLFQRLGASGAALVEAARLFVWPVDQVPNYRAQNWLAASPIVSVLGWCLWLLPAAIGAKLCAGLRRATSPRPALALGLLLAPLCALPMLQFVPAGEVFAARFLYVPMLLGTPALGFVLQRTIGTLHGAKFSALAAFALVIACFPAARIYGSNRAYELAILKRFPTDRAAWNGLGLALEVESDIEGARDAWLHAIALDPTYGRPHSNLGRIALEIDGDEQVAFGHFEQAARLGLGNPTAWINLGSMQLRLNDPTSAASSYKRATVLAPGNGIAWSGLCKSHRKLEHWQEARDAYQRATKATPKSAPAWAGLAEALRELGSLEEAKAAIRQAQKLDPENIKLTLISFSIRMEEDYFLEPTSAGSAGQME